MKKYKILTDNDLKALNLSDSELLDTDNGLYNLLNNCKTQNSISEKKKCCKECDCSGFVTGILVSTECRSCSHNWKSHTC